MIGFSLMHIHPGLAIIGLLGSVGFIAWLLPAIPYAIVRRQTVGVADIAMLVCAVFVTAALTVPDNFFA
jgi:hypothetical protein